DGSTIIERMVISREHTTSSGINIRMEIGRVNGPVTIVVGSVEAIAPVSAPCKSGTIDVRTPPSASGPTAPPSAMEPETVVEPAKTVTPSKRPTGPWVITYVESPCPGPGIIEAAVPRIVIKTRSIDDRRSIDKGVQISGGITHIDIIGRHVIDIYIFGVVQRRGRRDPVYFVRTFGRYNPRTVRTRGLEPDPIVDNIIHPVIFYDRRARIGSILHIGALQRRKLRIAIIGYRGGGRVAIHLRGLRYLRIHDRLPCRIGAGDAGQHIILGASIGYFCEIGREHIACNVMPSARQRPRGIPAPGDQHVVLTALILEDIVGGVARIR